LELCSPVAHGFQTSVRLSRQISAMTIEEAKRQALSLATSLLVNRELDPVQSLHLLQVVAIVHGHSTLAILIQRWPDYTCPSCDEIIDFGGIDDTTETEGADAPLHSTEVSDGAPTTHRKKWWQVW
jgi:hypothetical protein